jgi:hypothetical protein
MIGGLRAADFFVGRAKRSVPTIANSGAMVGTAQARLCPPYKFLLRYLAKRLADRQHGVPDQSRILYRGLTVFHRLAI